MYNAFWQHALFVRGQSFSVKTWNLKDGSLYDGRVSLETWNSKKIIIIIPRD